MGLGGFIGLSVQAEFLNRSRRHNAQCDIFVLLFCQLKVGFISTLLHVKTQNFTEDGHVD